MNPNKQAIISFANSAGNYVKGLARLSESLRNNFDGDFIGFIGEASIGAPPHSENPYAFKIYAFQKAIEAGYEKILWVDSSCFAVANVQPVFDEIERDGFIFQEAGQMLGKWTNDKTLAYFGITRDEAMDMRMVGNAGFFGLNMNNPTAKTFFDAWLIAMEYGLFKGTWNNSENTESLDERCEGHRHDMSVSSCLVNILGLSGLMKKGNEWLQYAGPYDKTLNDTIIFKAQGA